ncbi:MAG: threonylcarbamoyl-AMP synthase [Thermoprotei archaeon]|nr:MAG: threonylcarbamoyl-AMP synthase [Thermoprotei archaeon]
MTKARKIRITSRTFKDALLKAADVIKRGGVVAIPTDTSYGLAANALDINSVNRVFHIKQRNKTKVVSIFVDSIESIKKYFILDDTAYKLLSLLPERLTLILKAKEPGTFPEGIVNKEGGVGVRLPPSIYPLELVKLTGVFLTATSANISGKPPIYDPSLIEKELRHIDLILDAGILKKVPTSTVVDLTNKPPVILREGAISLKFLEKITGLRFKIL